MNVSIFKGLALCGLSLVLAGTGSAASAQSYRHSPDQTHRSTERAAIQRQKAAYTRAVANGRYRAAERAHKRASEIRRDIRTQRQTHTAYRR